MRDIPEYAITYSPHLKYPGEMNYQTFGQILARDGVTLVGLRADESITRRKAIAALLTGKSKTCMGYPIYDWKDTDVWRYIRDNDLYFPEIYCRLYEAGVPRNRLRLSAFFGDNTTHGLRYIAETDNELWERILVRMPNANLALLYWDSEMFRRSTKKRQSLEGDTKADYKEKCYDLLFKNTDKYTIGADTIKRLGAWRSLFLKTYDIATPRHHKMMYESILYGDPKSRQLRAITNMIYSENGKRQRNGKA